jgi:hypothetical protein
MSSGNTVQGPTPLRLKILWQARMDQRMEQVQQSATLISCKADKASQAKSRALGYVAKIIGTIGKPMLTLKKLLTFSGIAFPRPIPIDRPEPDDVQEFPAIPAMHEKITSYADLQKLIHNALRVQHPEWIGSNGESEMCEFYEARFAKLLGGETIRGCASLRAEWLAVGTETERAPS